MGECVLCGFDCFECVVAVSGEEGWEEEGNGGEGGRHVDIEAPGDMQKV
jgi:hypothetical protein